MFIHPSSCGFQHEIALNLDRFSDEARQRELIRIEMSRIIQEGLLGKTVIEKPPDWRDLPSTLAESFTI